MTSPCRGRWPLRRGHASACGPGWPTTSPSRPVAGPEAAGQIHRSAACADVPPARDEVTSKPLGAPSHDRHRPDGPAHAQASASTAERSCLLIWWRRWARSTWKHLSEGRSASATGKRCPSCEFVERADCVGPGLPTMPWPPGACSRSPARSSSLSTPCIARPAQEAEFVAWRRRALCTSQYRPYPVASTGLK